MRAGRLAPVLLLAGCLVALTRLGGDQLAVPLGTVDGVAEWAGATEPVSLAMAVLRLAAQLLCSYLLLAALLQVLADALGYPWLAFLARKAVPFAVRHALSGGAGLSLAAGSVLGATAGSAGAGPRPGHVVVTTVDDAASGSPTATMTLLGPAPPAPTATMVLLDPPPADAAPTGAMGPGGNPPVVTILPEPVPVADAAHGTDTDSAPPSTTTTRGPATTQVAAGPPPTPPPVPPSTPSTAATGDPPAAVGDDHEVWVVDAGDSFWSIAEDVVGAGDRTQAYWEQLIAANRGRLAVPDQPDLLFPGQRLTLPPPVPRVG